MSSAAVSVGRYQLLERIGAGGTGEVWRGLDTVLGRPVAVKLLRAEYAAQPEALARFRLEARQAGSLSHPAIAVIHDFGEPRGARPPYLVMELVEGPSLAAVLAGGPLAPARAMEVIAQTAAGLHAAHVAGLVHRDIKPANLLLGGDGLVKITDFGIAYSAGAAPVTRTGLIVGTPAYLAPERVGGARATPASDLYALGIVAYECLAGHPPFAGTPLEVAAAHRDRALPPLPATVPAGVAALVADLTAKDPAARPASADAVAQRAWHLRGAGPRETAVLPGAADESAEQTLVGLPVPGPPPGPMPGGRRMSAVAWVALAAAVILLVGLLGALAGGALTGADRTAPTPPAHRPSLVNVDAAALIGQPVGQVRGQLGQLGLVIQVLWRPSHQQPPGTVVSVVPGGRVQAGSVVVVTGVVWPGHSKHDHGGQGNGNGNGNGHGD